MAPLSSVELATFLWFYFNYFFPTWLDICQLKHAISYRRLHCCWPKVSNVLFSSAFFNLVNTIPITAFPLTILSRTSMPGLLRFTHQPNQSFIPPPNLAAASGYEKLCLLPVQVHVTPNCGSRLEVKDLSLDEFWVNWKRGHGFM